MVSYKDFGFAQPLEQSLDAMGYKEPTEIQSKTIPIALQGKDILGSAQTGTGKTAAFAIPLVEMLLNSNRGSGLILAPTRELAKQVIGVIHQLLGKKTKIRTAFLIGGEPMGKQLVQLKARPRIIVGTPGRINDHLERGTLMLHDANYFVLDETDRMLDMGFSIQIENIMRFLPKQRQTLMFSATLPKAITKMANDYMNHPERIAVGSTNKLADKVEHKSVEVTKQDKPEKLKEELSQREGTVIVFMKTKFSTERMAKSLRNDGFKTEALHGDLRQNRRDSVMRNLQKKKFRILVATDIAARGLDVPHVEHVINYDLPQVAEDFIHRLGRTARAGAEGEALSFVAPEERRIWNDIQSLLDPDFKPEPRKGKGKGGGNSKKKRFRKFKNKNKSKSFDKPRNRASGGGKKQGSSSK